MTTLEALRNRACDCIFVVLPDTNLQVYIARDFLRKLHVGEFDGLAMIAEKKAVVREFMLHGVAEAVKRARPDIAARLAKVFSYQTNPNDFIFIERRAIVAMIREDPSLENDQDAKEDEINTVYNDIFDWWAEASQHMAVLDYEALDLRPDSRFYTTPVNLHEYRIVVQRVHTYLFDQP